ncbi:hypothetical protein [Beijerinckia indica]|uniref:Uncharacterized protein n=1 Tax=Beijerinckia indica subsp. indica (strain ATCC 9039 / DSM 1715 / NCIMB 8712) TaxID=395963 RepID=B2ICL9_BEII9|nr:hypothetical protein [Beijerinckia indica]ACB93908.1 hypothetical protein Bind_0252 [Beijerinckia indica subsp. indica ATCC 9039]
MLPCFPRSLVLTAAGAVLFCLALPATAAQRGRDDTGGVPVLDVKSTCKEAQNYGTEDKRAAYTGCLQDEEQARQQLKAQWKKFKPKDKENCVASSASVMPSYVEVLTCLEMSQENNLPEYQPERKWPTYSTVPNPNAPSPTNPAETTPRYHSLDEKAPETGSATKEGQQPSKEETKDQKHEDTAH